MGRLRKGVIALLAALAMVFGMPAAAMAAEGDVAQIVGGASYATLDEAIAAAKDGDSIELLNNGEIKQGFDKELTFVGNGSISVNQQLSYQGTAWPTFTKSLTFDGIEVNWTSDGSDQWLIFCLSGSLNITNGSKFTIRFSSEDSASRNAIYMNAGSSIDINNGSTFQIVGEDTEHKTGQGIQLDQAGKAAINVTGDSTFLIDGTNRGYVNSPSITVNNSTFTVQNCTNNGSNGGNFTATNGAKVSFLNNAVLGLSTNDLSIQNGSQLVASGNGSTGVTVGAGDFLLDGTSSLIASSNGTRSWGAGLNLTNSNTGLVESGAKLEITGNNGDGLDNQRETVIEEGAHVTITNNTDGNGGGIYNPGSLTLPSNAAVYNNHASTSGADIYSTGTITFGRVGSDWKLDGVDFEGNLADCTDAIDGWYDDSKGSRWEAHNAPYHAEVFDEFTNGLATVKGTLALKAAHGLTPLDPGDETGWETSKSKTATNLDANYDSEVTLSLPAAEEQLVSDVVFVLDKSTSTSVEDEIVGMLQSLSERVEDTGAKVKVGVVIFNARANTVFNLAELNEQSLPEIAEAIRTTISSGTNTHAGLLAGTAMLDADKDVADSRKHLIFVSDGITYIFDSDAKAIGIQNGDKTNVFAGPDNWSTKYGNNEAPANWDAWIAQISGQIEADNGKYDAPYDGTDFQDLLEQGKAIAYDDRDEHAMSIDRALYETYQVYQAASSKYNCYAINATSNADHPWAKSFMEHLARGKQVDFSTIENDIYYLLDAGSSVVDYIGSGTDDKGCEYDFSFVDDLDRMTLTVGDVEQKKVELVDASFTNGVTSAYGFGAEHEDHSYDYELYYYANGTEADPGEHFVWKINVPVSNFAPVELTYAVHLENPTADGEEHGVYSGDGSSDTATALYTNNEATLYPFDSNEEQGVPENFPKPTVSYQTATVTPAEITIYMGGTQGYEGVVTGEGDDDIVGTSTNSLPEPGYYVELPDTINSVLQEALKDRLEDGEDVTTSDEEGTFIAVDLSDIVSVGTIDGTKSWAFEAYGHNDSTAYDRFVYRIVPSEDVADTPAVRLQFTPLDENGNADGEPVPSDSFDPSEEGRLQSDYAMSIYPGDNNDADIVMTVKLSDEEVYTLPVFRGSSTLHVRYVVDSDENNNPVTGVVNDINDEAVEPDNAYAVIDQDANYYVNESGIDVAADQGAAPSLLFDSIVTSETGESEDTFDSALLKKSEDVVAGVDSTFQVDGHESKYLDLVDANNGNTWLTTNSDVTVYWPYPAGTTKNTEFHLVHFQGLDRGDNSNDELVSVIDEMNPGHIQVETTDNGVRFTLTPDETTDRVAFSPFVLVWGTSGSTPTPDPDPDPDPTPDPEPEDPEPSDPSDPTDSDTDVSKELGGRELEAGEFTFSTATAEDYGSAVSPSRLTATNAADGSVDFGGGFTFSEEGTYDFVISEVLPSDDDPEADGVQRDGVTYDEATYRATATVEEVDGKLQVTWTVDDAITFTNDYHEPEQPAEPDQPSTPEEPGKPEEGLPGTGDAAPAAIAAVAGIGLACIAGAVALRKRGEK